MARCHGLLRKTSKSMTCSIRRTTSRMKPWGAGAAALVPSGSILVVVRGMILARMFRVTMARVPMAINQDLKALTANPHVDGEYLAWLLRASAAETLSRLDEAGHGTKALRMDAWGDMQVPVPPIAEQREIADYLRQTCAAMDFGLGDLQRGIALLQERRTALDLRRRLSGLGRQGLAGPGRRVPDPFAGRVCGALRAMSLHNEIHFEADICAHLAAAGWLYAEATPPATTAPGRCSPPTCWPGCRPPSPRPGRR